MLIDGIGFLKSTAAEIPPLCRESHILPKGSVHGEGAKPLECDILFERDVPVRMRDGVTIYTDIFRPVTNDPVPGIVAWSPYGKDKHRLDIPWYVAAGKLSNLQKFEGPDPGYWCAKGYAVLQPDARGVGNSEGNVWHWGHRRGQGCLRPDRMGRRAELVQREPRHGRDLLAGHHPVAHRGARPAPSESHRAVGRRRRRRLLRVFAVQRTLNLIIIRTGVLLNVKKRVPRKVSKFFNTLRGFSKFKEMCERCSAFCLRRIAVTGFGFHP